MTAEMIPSNPIDRRGKRVKMLKMTDKKICVNYGLEER